MSDDERRALNRRIIDEFRANEGRVQQFTDYELLLLTTIGAKSGEPRTWPLAFHRAGANLVVFAANGGRGNRPGWYYNLRANPAATVEVGTETYTATAEFASASERQRLWDELVEKFPAVTDFQAKVSWEIPVITLTRAD
ncbi:nitroreductase/quinone reductase family protein [Nocardia stercoris]|uniref:Nitroreductase family deazaflavin-dependent oxidoreductase n=1 Tax=Nocardia stercoris TaxID=2483361 RepID=A0A3M2KZB4_9NOCA|nr:nitroreductase/quinone reductase family protein [Nocardia stercoris]RMI30792.1 nitroreductase family deazaflavin-dependent oxidoreductase [Nocardia stercoris]